MPHEASNVQADFTYDPAQNWGEEARGGWMKTYYLISRDRKLVVLRLGDGGVFKFRMDVNPKSSFLYPILNNASFPMTVSYIPVENTRGTLEALNVDPEVYLFSGGVLASWDGEAYNPTRFRLTLEDGTVYVFDKYQGLLSITDPYGHTISYSDDAITHSSGASLSIERDTSNRIEYVRDQLGRTVEYQYDEDGMLVKVIQHGEGPYPMRVLEAMGYQKGIFERPVLKDIIAPDGTRLGTFEYDSSGRKTALIDHNGNRILFGYNAPSHEYAETNRLGHTTRYTYDSEGNVTSQTEAYGELDLTTTWVWDQDGNLLSETNPRGYTKFSTYDSDGNVISESDWEGNITIRSYTTDGKLHIVEDPLGYTQEYTYTETGEIEAFKDQNDHWYHFEYDADGLKTQERNPDGTSQTFEYNDQGLAVTQITYTAKGEEYSRMDNTYDGDGKLRVQDVDGRTIELEYDGENLTTQRIDGQELQYVYDANGNQYKTIYPNGKEMTYDVDVEGRPVRYLGDSGIPIITNYDAEGKFKGITVSDDLNSDMLYDAAGNLISEHVLGRTTQYEYDETGNPTFMEDLYGHTQRSAYDGNGNLIATEDPKGHDVMYAYDPLQRPTAVTFGKAGPTIQYEYDGLGQITAEIDANGRRKEFTYDERGNMTSVKIVYADDAQSEMTRYGYDPAGNLTQITNANGQVSRTMEYDSRGRVTKVIYSDGTYETFSYTVRGQVQEFRNRNGGITRKAYHDNGQLKRVEYPNGKTVSYVYNEDDQLLEMSSSDGATIEYMYEYGAVKRVDFHDGRYLEYGFTDEGLILRTPENQTRTYTLDEEGRLESVEDRQGGLTHYQWDANGNVSEVVYPNGTRTHFTYDDLDRVVNVEHVSPENQVLAEYTFDLLPNGMKQRVTEKILGATTITEYAYDPSYRLLSETITGNGINYTASYTYDKAGNRLSSTINGIVTTYTYNTLDQLIREERATEVITYTYTTLGQLERAEHSSGSWVNYEYNELGKLSRITDALGNEIILRYDLFGNLFEKTVNGVAERYLMEVNSPYPNLLTIYHADGTVKTTVDSGLDLISMRQGSQDTYYQYDGLGMHSSGLGRIGMLTDETGAMTDTYRYDAFGNVIARTGTTKNPMRFRSKLYDADTGLYDYHARSYNPAIGRFLTPDAAAGNFESPLTLHKYTLCENDPVNRIDPSGNMTLLEQLQSQAMRTFLVATAIKAGAAGLNYLAERGKILILLEEPAWSYLHLAMAGENYAMTHKELPRWVRIPMWNEFVKVHRYGYSMWEFAQKLKMQATKDMGWFFVKYLQPFRISLPIPTKIVSVGAYYWVVDKIGYNPGGWLKPLFEWLVEGKQFSPFPKAC